MKYAVILALVVGSACVAGEPGNEARPKAVEVAVPEAVEVAVPEAPQRIDLRERAGIESRPIDFVVPQKVYINEQPSPPSIGGFVRGCLYAPIWVLDQALDFTAGTLNASGQVLSIGTGATLGVLEAGSGALIDTGGVIELGGKRFTDQAVTLTQ